MMDERTLRTRCACGWETSGPADAVVVATIEHGGRVHNMVATPDQVLAQAEVVPGGNRGPGSADGDAGSTTGPRPA
jgi:hypothetical protein